MGLVEGLSDEEHISITKAHYRTNNKVLKSGGDGIMSSKVVPS